MIDDGSELFGSSTVIDGKRARDGFEALSALDDNGDGVIDARDAAFSSLRVWHDRNGDGRSQPEELGTLADHGVVSLSLKADRHEPMMDVATDGSVKILMTGSYETKSGRKLKLVDVVLEVK